jgi:hypothetical protein
LKVTIKSTVYFPDVPDELEIPPGTSLGEVLWDLFSRTHFEGEIVDKKNGKIIIEDMWEVRMNDVLSYQLPRDLDTELHDGDVITFSLMLLGGG